MLYRTDEIDKLKVFYFFVLVDIVIYSVFKSYTYYLILDLHHCGTFWCMWHFNAFCFLLVFKVFGSCVTYLLHD